MRDIIYTLGADIGSAASKCVILKNGEELVSSTIESAGAGTGGPARAFEGVLAQAGLERGDIAMITATGYGRNSFAEADLVISELSAHAMGAAAFFPGVRTVIDIGGQDAKVLRLTEGGVLDNFVMNDKCAAVTGGVAQNRGMIRALEQELSCELAVSPISQLCGAYGAALHAYRKTDH